MLEFLEQALGVIFITGLVVGYVYVVTQKPEMDKVYEQYLNRKK